MMKTEAQTTVQTAPRETGTPRRGDRDELVKRFCTRDDLSTYDPYDVWKTRVGFEIKRLYNRSRWFGPVAAAVTLADFANGSFRFFYARQEYPVVRAFAALSLLNCYRRRPEAAVLDHVRRHLVWLAENYCSGYNGYGWGIGFPHTVSRAVLYGANTPFSTITPYPLEAFIAYSRIADHQAFESVIEGIYRFFERDVQVMYEDDEVLATSYGPFQDRIVHNAISYTMYAYALLLPYLERGARGRAEIRIRKLYRYVQRAQRPDGSWFYSPEGRSFIDCFHSCIVLKNLSKTNAILPLEGSTAAVSAGYEYLKRCMLDTEHFLFRRFSVANKPSPIRFDLYDNAEMLNLAVLLGDRATAKPLLESVLQHFCSGPDVYSQIDRLGFRRSKNTLRWAVMPFLYAVSQF